MTVKLAFLVSLILLGNVSIAAANSAEPGDTFILTSRYNPVDDKFENGAAEGEGDACWEIIQIGEKEVDARIVAGKWVQVWAAEPYKPGFETAFSDYDGWTENNPRGKPPTSFWQVITIVESCPNE